MNCRVVVIGLSVLVVTLCGAPSLGAEDGPATAEDAASAPRAAFDETFAAYKAAIREIERLRTSYQTADEATRSEINTELGRQIADAKTLVDSLLAAAIELYRSAPNTDPEVTDFLMAVAKHYVAGREIPYSNGQITGGDQYELALPVIKLLIDTQSPNPAVPVWGLVTAAATNDFDLEKRCLDLVRKSGALANADLFVDAADKATRQLALQFAATLDEQREKWDKEAAIRAAEAAADDLPRVRLATTQGDITLELFENEAPQTVANFVTLVRRGYYDGVAFHRVLPKFMAQTGAPNDDGTGGPGYTIRCECHEPNARMHFCGSLSMAHRGRDTGSSQFFMTVVPTPHLDGKHTVFGRVIEGIEVLPDLRRGDPVGQNPDRILKAEVLRDRGHEYTFERLPE